MGHIHYKITFFVLLFMGTMVERAFLPSATSNSTENNQQPPPFLIVRTTDRVRASLPSKPVELAQPMRIPLELRGPDVKAIFVTQSDGRGILTNRHGETTVGNERAKVVAQDKAGKTIEVTPLQVGDVELEVTVEFSDGAEEIDTYTIKVEPTSTGLKKFTLNQGLSVLSFTHAKGSEMNERFFDPEAYYEGLDYPIRLPRNLSKIQIAVDQPGGNPVISIDGDGNIRALRTGKAMITGKFGGMVDRVLAIVE